MDGYRTTSHDARDVGYCEDCRQFSPWLTVVALGGRCICGSTQVSRGVTGPREKITSD